MITMKRRLLIQMFLCVLCASTHVVGAEDDKPIVRSTKPTDGGTALFSWHEVGSDKWRFALLPANSVERLKSPKEVATAENTIEGVEALKRKLSSLAINEKVGWFNMLEPRGPAPENLVFEFPPKEVIKDLELYCTVLKVRLNIYVAGAKK